MREFRRMEEVDVGRYITKEVMEAVRIPRIFLPIVDQNEGNDKPMPQYVPPFIPEDEDATIGDRTQNQEQQQHFEQPQDFPQQQQPQYVTYVNFQQFQQNQIGIQTELGNYKQEIQGVKDKQQELYNHYNNIYNYMKEKQKYLAKELDEIKRFQVGQTMMTSSQTDPVEKLNMTVGELRNEMIMIKRQLKEWTKNASYKDTYCCWAIQQTNPNLTVTNKIHEIMEENANKGRNFFHGLLKSDAEAGSSFAPTPGPDQAPSQHDHH
ncbi:hypothetical protein PIB30_007868 [Stylosanthes scabra]|uniref:Uncharacterized protein n=1 Tax=Stylosanthes scabra TaxID=79078 RepID=A0ABU6R590_9FABA|nr:hypothetical protein [Stylosanthes scabra]